MAIYGMSGQVAGDDRILPALSPHIPQTPRDSAFNSDIARTTPDFAGKPTTALSSADAITQ